MLIVFTTAPNKVEADSLAERIVAERLAACVQVLPQMTSYYFWEGRIRREREHLLLIKTNEEKYRELEAFIKQNRSYDVPEIVAVRSENVSDTYLGWLTDYLAKTSI